MSRLGAPGAIAAGIGRYAVAVTATALLAVLAVLLATTGGPDDRRLEGTSPDVLAPPPIRPARPAPTSEPLAVVPGEPVTTRDAAEWHADDE